MVWIESCQVHNTGLYLTTYTKNVLLITHPILKYVS